MHFPFRRKVVVVESVQKAALETLKRVAVVFGESPEESIIFLNTKKNPGIVAEIECALYKVFVRKGDGGSIVAVKVRMPAKEVVKALKGLV